MADKITTTKKGELNKGMSWSIHSPHNGIDVENLCKHCYLENGRWSARCVIVARNEAGMTAICVDCIQEGLKIHNG